jgi:hypothetical protein
MFRRFLLKLFLIVGFYQLCCGECLVKMPNKKELQQLFAKWQLESFVGSTEIIKEWAEQELAPQALEKSKYLWLAVYQEQYQGSTSTVNLALQQTETSLNAVIDEILEDNPRARKKLLTFRKEVSSKVEASSKKSKCSIS